MIKLIEMTKIDTTSKLKNSIQKIESVGVYPFELLSFFKEIESFVKDIGLDFQVKELRNIISNYEREMAISRYSQEYVDTMYQEIGKDFLISVQSEVNKLTRRKVRFKFNNFSFNGKKS